MHILFGLVWYFFVMVCLFAMMRRSATAGLIFAVIVFFFIARSALKDKPAALPANAPQACLPIATPKKTREKAIAKADQKHAGS
jgi:hypothetical protein